MLKILLRLLVLQTAIAIFISSSLQASPPAPWDIEELVGKGAPDFTLKDINERIINLSSFRGKTVILNFWATWCPPCRAEMPSLNSLYREFRNSGLVVIAIAADRNISAVKDYISKNPIDFTVLIDPDNKVSRQYKVFSIPTTFLIDRNGTIIEKYLGEENWASPKVKKKIREVLIRVP